jgi:glycosyltransferase involved in cell wall biosynthesis
VTAPPQRRISILIPAHNEADYIGDCLTALYASEILGHEIEVLVLANGCTDETVARAREIPAPEGWRLRILERAEGGKLAALSEGDRAATGDILVYLDADVQVETDLLAQIAEALGKGPALYASGTPCVVPAQSAVTRAYARAWVRLPFVRIGTPGFGIFAMTRAGRARWQDWPAIISDDTFARLNFRPKERVRLPGRYHWPMVEGFRNLTRVRRRQDRGVEEIKELFPQLLQNDDRRPSSAHSLARVALTRPLAATVYVAVALAVQTNLFASNVVWTRGR